MIKSPILLKHPNFEKRFIIECDASNIGYGAVLKQHNEIISMCSKVFQNAETRWPIREKELFSCVFACDKFKYFIHGRDDTIIKTDHHSLSYLHTMRISPKISR
eukprot:NODE_47_length_32105_cov_1.240892.p30 type:complete len:104 gc:universal NODE_47_length_32105_cov_1.240892:1803-1492(-)